jgi:hypothetical protein
MTAGEKDPFSKIYDALWATLDANAEFVRRVLPRNEIRYAGTVRNPEKEDVQPADFPEVRIVAAGWRQNLYATSDATSVARCWQIQVRTGDRRLEVQVYPVEFEILRAFAGWDTVAGGLKGLTWSGQDLRCVPVFHTGGEETLDPRTTSIAGWTAVLTVTVEIWFSTASLKPVT